jgi:aldehyde:ferredoxin oxidoreductase
LINQAVGSEWTIKDLLKSGERGWNLKRAMNIRLGLNRANDRLPELLLTPLPDGVGKAAGFVPDLESMLAAYYRVRGWDSETGFPTREKLLELGLDFVIPDIYPKENNA